MQSFLTRPPQTYLVTRVSCTTVMYLSQWLKIETVPVIPCVWIGTESLNAINTACNIMHIKDNIADKD